jgi:hypothetical protein
MPFIMLSCCGILSVSSKVNFSFGGSACHTYLLLSAASPSIGRFMSVCRMALFRPAAERLYMVLSTLVFKNSWACASVSAAGAAAGLVAVSWHQAGSAIEAANATVAMILENMMIPFLMEHCAR